MMNQNEMTMECLHLPKALFLNEKYKSLSNTAKILYGILLERLAYAGVNDWIDEEGEPYVIYPKNDMKQDLNCTRYRADMAIRELENAGDLILVMAVSGKANRFYVHDVRVNEMEEEDMMTLERVFESMTEKDRNEIFAKIDAVTREIAEEIAGKGYLPPMENVSCVYVEEDEAGCSPMEYRGYFMDDECEKLDVEQIEADACDFADEVALDIASLFEENPKRLIDYKDFLNEKYNALSKRKFITVLETVGQTIGSSPAYMKDMYACQNHKEARKIYLAEFMSAFNSILDTIIDRVMDN